MATIIDAGLESYLSGMLGVPIWANYIPQIETTYSFVTYLLVYENRNNTLAKSAGLAMADYQIDVWGNQAAVVEQLNEQVRGALESYRGMMGSVLVTGCRMVDSFQDCEVYPDGSDQRTYRLMTEWNIWYKETIPN